MQHELCVLSSAAYSFCTVAARWEGEGSAGVAIFTRDLYLYPELLSHVFTGEDLDWRYAYEILSPTNIDT